MECDSDHALIKKNKKKSNISIYHPHDWLQLVRQTGKKKPSKVNQMCQDDFFDYSALFNTTLKVKNVKKQRWGIIEMEKDKVASIHKNRSWYFTIQRYPRYFKTISIYLTIKIRTSSCFIYSSSNLQNHYQ